jgi:Cof subfamily protein (haloacid dehalogenase superfamily)
LKYRLLAIDLDDSLLNDDIAISEKNKEAIRHAVDRGVIVTIATGRMLRATTPFVKHLGIDFPIITYQGALIANSLSKDVLLHIPVDLDYAREIIGECHRNNVHLQVFVNDMYFYEKDNRYSDIYRRVSGIEGEAVGPLLDFLTCEPTKLVMIDEPENIQKWQKYFGKKYEGRLEVVVSKANYLEFTHIEATKGNALKFLAGKHGIKQEEIIAIGDSFNDITMLRYAGLGVAMGNASEIVKSQADYVTYTNNEDGVAHVIEKFIVEGGKVI